jgi:hypothetical protein
MEEDLLLIHKNQLRFEIGCQCVICTCIPQ